MSPDCLYGLGPMARAEAQRRDAGLTYDDGTPVVPLRERARRLEAENRNLRADLTALRDLCTERAELFARAEELGLEGARNEGITACIVALETYHDEIDAAADVCNDLLPSTPASTFHPVLNALCTALDRVRALRSDAIPF